MAKRAPWTCEILLCTSPTEMNIYSVCIIYTGCAPLRIQAGYGPEMRRKMSNRFEGVFLNLKVELNRSMEQMKVVNSLEIFLIVESCQDVLREDWQCFHLLFIDFDKASTEFFRIPLKSLDRNSTFLEYVLVCVILTLVLLVWMY